MLIDTRQLADGEALTADVCIIGAGPAGTTLANELLDSGLDVLVLESGTRHADHRIQRLSGGEVSGDADEPPEETHLRQLGGTANHWIIKMADKQYGYRYVPLTPVDFEARAGVPHSGWPITRAELDPYYERAHRQCRVGPFRYGPGNWETAEQRPLALHGDRVQTDFFMFGPTGVFTQEFPERLAAARNTRLVLQAHVTELLTNRSGERVETAVARTFDGKEIRFHARHFVIAAGGYQTPRLLLASRRHDPRGIGNTHDVVGRYYVDHSLVPSGNFHPRDLRLIDTLGLYDMRLMEGASVLGKLALTDDTVREEGLPHFTATLFPMPPLRDVDALWSLKEVAVALKGRRLPPQLGTHLLRILRGSPYLTQMMWRKVVRGAPLMPGFGQGGWSKFKNNHKKFHRLELLAFAEQLPDPDNRITLTEQTDELGMPLIRVHFQWRQDNIDGILRAQEIMAEALEGTGLGHLEPARTEDRKPVIGAQGLHHLMGTTRMHDDPTQGVVDRNCTVHGVPNLHIASSSVFTTGGYANPTLTILALAIRLADHLKQLD